MEIRAQTQNIIITAPDVTTSTNGLTITAFLPGAAYQWINCGTSNSEIEGQTSQSYTVSENGSYAVIVTENGCSDTSACVTISTVGVDEAESAGFKIYPNPNGGTFVIETSRPLTIRLTNATGQLINTQELQPGVNQIQLGDLSTGIYLVWSVDENGSEAIRRMSVSR